MVDEMSVAGVLVDRPIPIIRCKTVDIMVPADAEIVIEGYLNTEYSSPKGPSANPTATCIRAN